MQTAENKNLFTLITVYLSLTIIESVIWLLANYFLVPLMARRGTYEMANYMLYQSVFSGILNIINVVLLILIAVQVTQKNIKILIIIFAIVQFLWAIAPLIRLAAEKLM